MRHLTPTSCAPQHFLESTFKNLTGPANHIQYGRGPDKAHYFALFDPFHLFLSATEYFPSRTIIQPWWVSSSSSLSCTFSRWDNSRTPWAIKLIFCMVTSHDYLLWIRIREPISLMLNLHLSQSLFFGKKFHDGLTRPIFIRFCSNFVQRLLVSLWIETECLKWLRPFFNLPARPTKTDQ